MEAWQSGCIVIMADVPLAPWLQATPSQAMLQQAISAVVRCKLTTPGKLLSAVHDGCLQYQLSCFPSRQLLLGCLKLQAGSFLFLTVLLLVLELTGFVWLVIWKQIPTTALTSKLWGIRKIGDLGSFLGLHAWQTALCTSTAHL